MLLDSKQIKAVISWYKDRPCYIQAMLLGCGYICDKCPHEIICDRLTMFRGIGFETIVR